jgi:hypothetical protein
MKLNQRAFTVLEVIIAVAISTILGLGIMTMLSESYKHDRVLNIKQLARDLKDDVKFMMGSTRNCAIVSSGSIDVSVNFSIPITKDGDGIAISPRYPVGLARSSYFEIAENMKFNNGKIIIDGLDIGPYISRQDVTSGTAPTGYFPIATDIPLADNHYFIGELDIRYHSATEGTLGGTTGNKVAPFTVVLTLDPTHTNIVECRLMDNISDAATLCASISGATWDTTGLKCILPEPDPSGGGSGGGNMLTTFQMGCVTKNYGTSNSSCP